MLSIRSEGFVSAPWHLLLCRPNRNHIAFEQLRRRGFDVFMPRIPTLRRYKGRLKTETRAVFSGYVFVAGDPDRPRWEEMRTTPGVARLIGFGANGPATVPSGIVAGLMQRCDADGMLQPDLDLEVGDRVRILSGPFAEFVTTIERIDPERRVHVMLELLGAATRVSLDPGAVRKIGEA